MYHLIQKNGDEFVYISSAEKPGPNTGGQFWVGDECVPVEARKPRAYTRAGAWYYQEPTGRPEDGTAGYQETNHGPHGDLAASIGAAALIAEPVSRPARELRPEGLTVPELEAVACPDEECDCTLDTVCADREAAALAARPDPDKARRL